jgi:hypothetical protein
VGAEDLGGIHLRESADRSGKQIRLAVWGLGFDVEVEV